jgi:lysophospholipase L1-like esterase
MNNLKRLLALGDSYTIGEAVADNERWPAQFISMLGSCGVEFDTPEIIATTGWTTGELLLAIEKANPKGPYDMVSLLIGVNNQYRGHSLEDYKVEFEKLLKNAIFFAEGDVKRVLVISIPDWGVTPFAADRDGDKIATEIDAFNQENKSISSSYGVDYIDITPHSRLARHDHSLTASDKLHPSNRVYTYWAELISQWYLNKHAKTAG